jgi:hypothetical protein
VDPRASLDDMEKRKFLTLPGLEFRPLSCLARSQLLYRLSYSTLKYVTTSSFNVLFSSLFTLLGASLNKLQINIDFGLLRSFSVHNSTLSVQRLRSFLVIPSPNFSSIYLSIYLYICLSVCPSICLSIYLYIYISIYGFTVVLLDLGSFFSFLNY